MGKAAEIFYYQELMILMLYFVLKPLESVRVKTHNSFEPDQCPERKPRVHSPWTTRYVSYRYCILTNTPLHGVEAGGNK